MLSVGLGGFGNHVYTFHDCLLLLHEDFKHTALFAAVFTCEHIDNVAFLMCNLCIT